jgi:siderophore synthetase component
MKTLSRHLADNFPADYKTRVEPQDDGHLVVRVGYPINGTEAIRMVSGRQVENGLLVETILEDMRNELARTQ